MSFESDLKRLEEITELLKNPEVGLEKSIELYEEANKLSSTLSKTLEDIKRRVEKVNTTNEDEMETIDFNEVSND